MSKYDPTRFIFKKFNSSSIQRAQMFPLFYFFTTSRLPDKTRFSDHCVQSRQASITSLLMTGYRWYTNFFITSLNQISIRFDLMLCVIGPE